MTKSLCFAAVCLWASPAFAEAYVANSYGIEGRYQVFTFSAAGVPQRRVSGPHDAAWPSAIRVGQKIHVFATVRRGNRWSELRRWTSRAGGGFRDEGAVFSAGPDEPHGIGPATVTYDGKLFRAFYLVRGKGGPGERIGLATSVNGRVFRKMGTVFSAADPSGGLAVSYACTDGPESYLFLHAYGAGQMVAISAVATSKSPDGPYGGSRPIFRNSGASGALTGPAGKRVASFIGLIEPGRPIVVLGDGPESYVVKTVVGSVLHLDRPLTRSYQGAPFADLLRSKVDLSFVAKDKNGAWQGAVTGYGQFEGVTSEYSAPIIGRSIIGPWKTTRGYFVSPYFPSGKLSTENPEPIRSGSACTMTGIPQ
jgi:hypothetical protein